MGQVSDKNTQHLLYYLKRMLEQMLSFINETIKDNEKKGESNGN